MNSLISIVIGLNIMISPMPAPETKEIEAAIHPAAPIDKPASPILQPYFNESGEIIFPDSSIIYTQDCMAQIDSKESAIVETHSIIGDGFETHPCPQNYPGCMVVRWEETEGKITTMCHFHKIRHKRE